MKRNQIYSFEALHDVMAVYDREFGIRFPRIRPKLESWDLRKSRDNKIVDHSDVVGAAPVAAAPTTSSFST